MTKQQLCFVQMHKVLYQCVHLHNCYSVTAAGSFTV